MRAAWLAVLVLYGVACREKPSAVKPAPVASISASVAAVASMPPPPPPEPSVWDSPELTPAVQARVDKWKARVLKALSDKYFRASGARISEPTGLITTKNRRVGAFDVIVARVPTYIVNGDPPLLVMLQDGSEDTYEELLVTNAGELALPDAPEVVGLVDVNGDGRLDLVLKNVTIVANTPSGPLRLTVADKGGAFGWREARIGTYEGTPAILATTEPTTSLKDDPLAGGHVAHTTKGILEEVTLQWDGKQLAAVSRKPLVDGSSAK